MASLDVDSLFTNILLDETIGICIKELFRNLETLVNAKWFLEFNKFGYQSNKIFIRVNRVVLGFPPGPLLVNISLSQSEEN